MALISSSGDAVAQPWEEDGPEGVRDASFSTSSDPSSWEAVRLEQGTPINVKALAASRLAAGPGADGDCDTARPQAPLVPLDAQIAVGGGCDQNAAAGPLQASYGVFQTDKRPMPETADFCGPLAASSAPWRHPSAGGAQPHSSCERSASERPSFVPTNAAAADRSYAPPPQPAAAAVPATAVPVDVRALAAAWAGAAAPRDTAVVTLLSTTAFDFPELSNTTMSGCVGFAAVEDGAKGASGPGTLGVHGPAPGCFTQDGAVSGVGMGAGLLGWLTGDSGTGAAAAAAPAAVSGLRGSGGAKSGPGGGLGRAWRRVVGASRKALGAVQWA